MSTRATLFHNDNVHIYQELLDGDVYIEIHHEGVLIDCKIMTLDEWKLITGSTERPKPITGVLSQESHQKGDSHE